MDHNKIYLIYTAVLFLVGLGFFIVGEFNKVEKPQLKDPDSIGEDEEDPVDNTAEISADEVQMPVPEVDEPALEDIELENVNPVEGEEGEDGEVTEDEEPEVPIYDGHEEERIELIKENYIAKERYDSNRWTIYFSIVFWVMALICAVLYFMS